MSLGTANRDGGKTSESGHLRSIMKGYLGQVLSGLAVSQRGAGANMSVDIAIGDAIIPRSDATYGHPAFNDAVLNQAIATADPSNPRRDIVVMYIDYGNAVSTGVSNNTNGVVKVKVVAGTPAGSPVDPTATAIQSSVGAGNPYIQLARVRVGAGVTSVGTSVIDDLRVMATGSLQGGWAYDTNTWVYVAANQFKIAGADVRTLFPVGTKIQVYQGSTVKYFAVLAASFSTDTTVTLDQLSSAYSLTNIPIDKPAYSYAAHPQGFPAISTYYSFEAYSHGAGATYSGDVVYPFDTVVSDPSGGYNTTNKAWTVPAGGTGKYDIYGQFQLNSGFTGTFFAHLQVNGVVVREVALPQSGQFGGGNALFPSYTLNAGDVIKISGSSSGSVSSGASLAHTYTQFSARMVSR